MAGHLRAETFGLRAGPGGAACSGYVEGDTISTRRTDDVTCPDCWQAYGFDRTVKLAAAQVRNDALSAQLAEVRQTATAPATGIGHGA